MTSRRTIYILSGGAIVVTLVAGALFISSTVAPWTPTGRLVIVVRATPLPDTDRTLEVGIDNMIVSSAEDTTQVTLLARRALLDPSSEALVSILDTTIRSGSYSGFSFILTSPELRNPWQGDAAPESVSLAHDVVSLPVSYQVVEGETTVILLSFETMQAMHGSSTTLLYLPVLQAETRYGSSVSVGDTGSTKIAGGAISDNATYGMDWDGRMRLNFRAPITSTPPGDETFITENPTDTTPITMDTASTTATSTNEDRAPGPSATDTSTTTEQTTDT